MTRKTAATAALASGGVTFRPLLPTGDADEAAVFAKAFDGLIRPGELSTGDTGDGYTFIRRRGDNIGSVQKDLAGNAFVVLSDSSRADDLPEGANLGTTGGIPVYLRDNYKVVHDQTREARYVADIFAAVKAAPDAAAADSALAGMGATADQIALKVRTGEMSIQQGEALRKGIFSASSGGKDSAGPAAFANWLSRAASADPPPAREEPALPPGLAGRDALNQSYATKMQQVSDVTGGGASMKKLSGVEPGISESIRDGLNEPVFTKSTASRISLALAAAGGDISKAIGIIRNTPASTRTSDFTDAESPFALLATDKEDLAQAATRLQRFKDQLDKEGMSPEKQKALVLDTAKAGEWTANDDDLVRELSTGELRINPGFLFGDRNKIIAAIEASGTDDLDKQTAVLNLDSARGRMQGRLFRQTLDNDSGFKAFARERWRPGRDDNDKAAILDAWAARQKNRAWIFQAGDAVREGIKSASVGIDKTLVGTGAGLLGLAGAGADLVGMDGTGRMVRQGAGYLGGIDSDMGKLLQGQREAARLRGQTGGFALTSDVVSAIGQALPMMVGGEVAAGLNGISKAVVGGMAIYGYGAAQGYEASISDAIATATAKKQSPLTAEETGQLLGDPRTQIGGFINAVAAAALSKAFPRGVERAALGKAVQSMTVRDFVAGGGLDAMRKGAFGKEIGAMAGTLFADATDQAIQGFTNQVISEVGNAYAHDKDIRLGDLLGGAFRSSGIAAVTGVIPTQARQGGDRAPAGEVSAAFVNSPPNPSENPFRNPDGTLPTTPYHRSAGDPDLAAKEAKFNSILTGPIPEADAAYNRVPDSHGGKVIGTDLVREVLPEYGTADGRTRYTGITTTTASQYGKDRLWREIHNRGGRKSLLFTAGGPGSGKSTVVTEKLINTTDLIYDGTLRDQKWAIQNIEEASKRGWGTTVVSVTRPLKLVAVGVVARAIGEGRPFALADLPDAHYSAQRSAINIAKHFENNPKVKVDFYDNGGTTRETPANYITLEEVDTGGKYSYDETHGKDSGRMGKMVGDPQQSSPRSDYERFRAATRQDIVGVFHDAVAGKITANGKPLSHEVLTGLAGKDEELQRILKDSGK